VGGVLLVNAPQWTSRRLARTEGADAMPQGAIPQRPACVPNPRNAAHSMHQNRGIVSHRNRFLSRHRRMPLRRVSDTHYFLPRPEQGVELKAERQADGTWQTVARFEMPLDDDRSECDARVG
jgi:hypothetical protein